MNTKQIKRWLSTAVAAVMLSSGIGFSPNSSDIPADAAALSGLSAKQIVSQMVIGWNLGNTLDSHGNGLSYNSSPKTFATAWGNPEPTKALFETVKEGGFNTVRIPVTWYQHLQYNNSTQTYEINDAWMDYVKKTVDYAYELDMFIILNVHHENWVNVGQFTDSTYAEASAKLGDIWEQVSEEFADYDQHLIFEGMNEPRQTGLGGDVEWGAGDNNSRAYINNLNEVFVDTVRGQGSSQNKERLLMLPGYCASSQADAVRGINVPSDGGNIALSVHAYAPYFFTMANDSYANHNFPGASGYGENYEGHLTSLFNTLKQISNEKNTPIIIGEFSASDFNNTQSRVNWAKDYLTKAKAAGIPCVLWDNNRTYDGTGEAHGYVNRQTNTWYDVSAPVIEAMMSVYDVGGDLPGEDDYVAPTFDWSKIPVGDDWVQLYYAQNGTSIEAWGNVLASNWRNYLNY